MPITPAHPTRRISQEEFGTLAYDVMQHVFAIRNEFGRFFDEKPALGTHVAARNPLGQRHAARGSLDND